jgi:hypothetical protein
MVRRLLLLASAAALALGACTTGATAAPVLTDPREILTQAIATFKNVKSLHLHADVSGQLKIDLTKSGNPGELDLKGTTADADVDITNKKAHLSFGAPLLLGLTGDIIMIDKTTYTKISLMGPKYSKSESTAASDPASAATDPQKVTDELTAFLNQPGVAPTKQADEKCGDRDCYHVSLNLTSDQLGGMSGALASAAPTGSGTLDIWVQKNDLHPAKLTLAANGGDQGTVAVTLTMSNYDAPVTISAPADAEVQPAAS